MHERSDSPPSARFRLKAANPRVTIFQRALPNMLNVYFSDITLNGESFERIPAQCGKIRIFRLRTLHSGRLDHRYGKLPNNYSQITAKVMERGVIGYMVNTGSRGPVASAHLEAVVARPLVGEEEEAHCGDGDNLSRHHVSVSLDRASGCDGDDLHRGHEGISIWSGESMIDDLLTVTLSVCDGLYCGCGCSSLSHLLRVLRRRPLVVMALPSSSILTSAMKTSSLPTFWGVRARA
jgi:hypothetical protein